MGCTVTKKSQKHHSERVIPSRTINIISATEEREEDQIAGSRLVA